MTFEGLLKQELGKIEELNDNIYPLSVPESVDSPYISYCLAGGDYLETLDGSEPLRLDYEVNILAEKYLLIKQLEKKVEAVIVTLKGQLTSDGTVKQVDLEVPIEQYEEQVKLQRANIKFSIYF